MNNSKNKLIILVSNMVWQIFCVISVPLILFTFFGYKLDLKTNNKPIFTILGIFIGFLFGILGLYGLSKKYK